VEAIGSTDSTRNQLLFSATSFDAELRAGHIDYNEARRRRSPANHSCFVSMDGAMKFVNVPRLPMGSNARRFALLGGEGEPVFTSLTKVATGATFEA